MTAQQAKLKGFTHHGKIYGFHIFLTDDEDTNWFNDNMIGLFTWIDLTFSINDCFAVEISHAL